jgi:hypothetical protein
MMTTKLGFLAACAVDDFVAGAAASVLADDDGWTPGCAAQAAATAVTASATAAQLKKKFVFEFMD